MRTTRTTAALILTATLALAGCTARPATTNTATEPAPTTAATTPASTAIEVPDLTGQLASDARDTLTAAGFTVKFDAGDDFVVKASNWTVTGQDATGTAEPGTTITLTVEKTSKEEASPEQPAARTATDAGLKPLTAQIACDNYAKNEFPYGYDPHWIIGKYEEVRAEEVFFKVSAEVTNAFNATRSVTIECYVTGTDDAPEIRDFLAY